LIELFTALLFLWVALWTPEGSWGLLVVRAAALAGLVVATFVDFERFEIPDEISLGGMALAPVASFLVPSLHAASPIPELLGLAGPEGPTRLGALATCLAGELAGGGVLLAVGWLGRRIYGRDAMGLGDVKLLAAGGGLVGPGGVFVALMLASVVASLVGLGNIARFLCLVGRRSARRGKRSPLGHRLAVARVAGRYVPFGPYLALGLGIVLLHWNDVARWLE
jgi:prepilin signal peptidase PulO-like enzyme (type II secretory pathway)